MRGVLVPVVKNRFEGGKGGALSLNLYSSYQCGGCLPVTPHDGGSIEGGRIERVGKGGVGGEVRGEGRGETRGGGSHRS